MINIIPLKLKKIFKHFQIYQYVKIGAGTFMTTGTLYFLVPGMLHAE